MNRYVYIILGILLAGCFSLSAQQFTLEYNLGYGSYRMSGLKDWMANRHASLPLENIKTTDNFPGYMTHSAKIGIAWRKYHQAGLLMDHMNTVGNKGVSDYSGSYNMTFRVKGVRLGGFYRFFLPGLAGGVVSPYLQFSTGVVLNNGKYSESLALSGQPESSQAESFGGANFFVEPAAGIKFRLFERIALNLNIGYEYDATQKFTTDKAGYEVPVSPDWTGLRVQGGLIYYIPLNRN